MASKKKQEEQQKQIAALVVLVVVLFVVFRGVIFKAKTGKDAVRGEGGAPVAGAGPGGSDAPLQAPTVTPTMIPMLTPEIKRKIKERHGTIVEGYSKEKLEVGINPFIPLGADISKLDQDQQTTAPAPGSSGTRKKNTFGKKLTFWGAFMPGPDEPKRVIVEVQGDPQPWTGTVGETIEGTPYRVEQLLDGDMAVVLKNPTNPNEKPVKLVFEGAKEDGAQRGSDADVDHMFGGGDAKPGAAKAPAGKSAVEPAFDR